MIFTLIGLYIIYLGFTNFKMGFLWMLVYKIVLVQNINMVAIPGLPLLTMDNFLVMAYIVLFYRKYKNNVCAVKFPYKVPYTLMCISWILSAIFSLVGFASAITQCLGNFICQSAILTYMMWVLLEEGENFKWLFKRFTYVFLFAALYAFFEQMTHTNPIKEYEMSLMTDETRLIDFDYSEDDRGWRVQSIFEHAIGSGINFALYCLFAFALLIKYKMQYAPNFRMIVLLTGILSIPASIFSNSSSPIIFMAISMLGLVDLRNSKFWGAALGLGVLFVVGGSMFSSYSDNIMRFFDSSAQDRVRGSSIEMRLSQLEASWQLMTQSPLFGLGFKFRTVLSNSLTEALLGMESVWFSVLTQFGLVGVVAYSTMMIYSIIVVPRKFHSKPAFFLSLAYWFTSSITSIPGTLTYMYYLMLIFFIKQSDEYKSIKNSFYA